MFVSVHFHYWPVAMIGLVSYRLQKDVSLPSRETLFYSFPTQTSAHSTIKYHFRTVPQIAMFTAVIHRTALNPQTLIIHYLEFTLEAISRHSVTSARVYGYTP